MIVACLAVCIFFASCEKETVTPNNPDNPDNPNNPNVRLVSYMYYDAYYHDGISDIIGEYYYEYDNQNRISKITSTKQMSGIWTVTYPSANTVRYETDGKYYLLTKNDEGYLINNVLNTNGNTVTENFEYENGYLKKSTGKISQFTIINNYYWSNGKLDKIDEDVTYNPALNSKSTFSYGTTPNEETNISPWTTSCQGYWLYPSYWTGKKSPNLMSSEIRETKDKTWHINYRYVFDTDGYVTKVFAQADDDQERLICEVKYK